MEQSGLVFNHTKRPKMTFLPYEIKFFAESKKKATINYIFTEKLKYNRNVATRYVYSKPRIVFFSTREDFTKKKKSERRLDSIARSRQLIYDIVQSNLGVFSNPPIFVTLTFKENITDLKLANTYFRAGIRRLNTFFSLKLVYLSVVEFQERGAIHYHVIFFNLPYIPVKKFEKIWSMGYTNIKAIKRVKNLSAYVCKYLTKETLDNRLVGQKVFFCSRHLKRPIEDREKLNFEEILFDYPLTTKIEKLSNLIKITYERKN